MCCRMLVRAAVWKFRHRSQSLACAHRLDVLRSVGVRSDHRVRELLQHLLDLVSRGLGILF